MLINMPYRIFGKELVLQLTRSLRILKYLLNVLALFATAHQFLGLDEFTLLNYENSICDIPLFEKETVFGHM